MKKILFSLICILVAVSCAKEPKVEQATPANKVLIAYVTSWSNRDVDPQYLTHINYAFGHVDSTFAGVRVDNPKRLQGIVALKKDYPHLKVLLSIGGWGSGNFSEMAADSALRWSFALDCAEKVLDRYEEFYKKEGA